MRLVFFGTPELALPSLAALHDRHEVTAAVCQPDKPVGRRGQPQPPPVKVWAEQHGIPVQQPDKLNDGNFERWLKDQRPEVCCIAAYGRILKKPILDVPPHGFLNVHPSLLPKHRGPSPIRSAILQGDAVTGVTIMRLDEGMDTGEILLQREVAIDDEDDAVTLASKLANVGAELLLEALDRVADRTAVFTPQDDSQATHTKLFEKADGRILWQMRARDIHNLVRAALPWPVAHSQFKGKIVRILRTQPVDEPAGAEPGTVELVDSDAIVVATGEGRLKILELQAPGRRPLPAADYLRGNPVQVGDRFEES